jgi:Phage protein Gp138 N-terminal domain
MSGQGLPTAYQGWAESGDPLTQFGAMGFVIKQALAKVATATLVQVKACTNSGGIAPVGFVDVQPLINQIDGSGKQVPHTTIFNLPYLRIQGGRFAVILDPVPGDIGIAIFADRDISGAKANRGPANPGSRRRHSMADGFFLGGVLNDAPTSFVQFLSNGDVTITSPGNVTVNCSNLEINGSLSNNGVNVGSTHEHTGVQTGSGLTGPPA